MNSSDLSKQNIGPALLGVAWVFATIATFIVGLRIYSRKQTSKIRKEDWLSIFTLFLALGNSVFCTISVSWGLGRHIQFLSPEQVLYSIKWIYLCEFFSIMSPGFGRISFALLLLNLVPPTKWRRIYLWTIIIAQFIVDIGTIIISFSQCQPIMGFWDPAIDANCWPPEVQEYTGYFQGSVCSAVDLALAAFPASLFWKLNMKMSTKVSLSILMGLGAFAMVASIAKTVELRAIADKQDATWAMCILAICWTLEAYLVLIAASIPTLKPLGSHRGPSQAKISKTGESLRRHTCYGRGTIKNNTTKGLFYPLNDMTRSMNNSDRISEPYSTTAYHSEFKEQDDNKLEHGRIRKDTSVMVRVENAAKAQAT